MVKKDTWNKPLPKVKKQRSKITLISIIVAVMIIFVGLLFLINFLWNLTMPLFGLPVLTFFQSSSILMLIILIKGILTTRGKTNDNK